ncbi:histidine phosphatase family protein [Bacillus sp. FJAT-45350]|uniref:histidine phosphatase family protein n=1 Tax=Bacillus sp. FJAT-45350 TaxID=2011014 RepID=UPI000BB698B9|nr:histidine phosphatase family protein [Bacillus sp. FJAT-45350]
MKLYIIRHGESMGNRLGKIQGWQDFELSPTGKKQAQLVGSYLSTTTFDAIYSSDLTRAYETAVSITDLQSTEVKKWSKIREIKLGPLEGKTKDEIHVAFPETKATSILTSGVQGTETIEEITYRCRDILVELLSKHQGQEVAIVSHGGLISILLMYIMLGDEWYRHHRPFKIDNTSMTLIEWQPTRKPIIHYINNCTHLEGKMDIQNLYSM